MEETMQDMDALVDRLAAKDKKRRRNALLYLGLPLAAGLALIFWTISQTQVLHIKESALRALQALEKQYQMEMVGLQAQLDRTREATKHIQAGLSSFYEGNYPAAIREYDKAIDLDPLNPVVLELKSVSLHKMGEAQKAAEILNKAAEIDSVRAVQRERLLRLYPAEVGTLKVIQLRDLLLEPKPDSQDVIRRKAKARELKTR